LKEYSTLIFYIAFGSLVSSFILAKCMECLEPIFFGSAIIAFTCFLIIEREEFELWIKKRE